jgi:hypothetical protein
MCVLDQRHAARHDGGARVARPLRRRESIGLEVDVPAGRAQVVLHGFDAGGEVVSTVASLRMHGEIRAIGAVHRASRPPGVNSTSGRKTSTPSRSPDIMRSARIGTAAK